VGNMIVAPRLWLTGLMLITLVCGCESTPAEEPSAPASTPLVHDPTDDEPLGVWWTNGSQLLHLGEDQHFALFATESRYREPSEQGRWSRQSYAALILEPYQRRRTESIRVGIDRREGRLTLQVRDLDPMWNVDDPPAQPEDQLIGGWQGDSGRLWLNAVGSYTFAPDRIAPVVVGHQGAWTLNGNELVCRPYPQTIEPFALIVRHDPGLTLANETLRFDRRKPIAE